MYFRGFTVNDDNADTVDRLSLYEDLNFIEVVPVVGLESIPPAATATPKTSRHH